MWKSDLLSLFLRDKIRLFILVPHPHIAVAHPWRVYFRGGVIIHTNLLCAAVSILPKARTPAQTPAQHARTWRTVFIGLTKGTQGQLPVPKDNGALFNL